MNSLKMKPNAKCDICLTVKDEHKFSVQEHLYYSSAPLLVHYCNSHSNMQCSNWVVCANISQTGTAEDTDDFSH